MSSFFSTLQPYVGALATVAAGAIFARVMNSSRPKPQAGESSHAPSRTEKRSDAHGDDGADPPQERQAYKPTSTDVLVVRLMLEKAVNLPPELLDLIIDQAEYWPHSEASIVCQIRNPRRDGIRVVGATEAENRLLLRCPPIGFVDYRKVGEAFKTAPLPPKTADGSIADGPLEHFTSMEPASSPTEPTHEAPREYFSVSMKQPPTLTHPVRKIVFKMRSRDQGWGGPRAEMGSYNGSWTYFEAGLEKFDKDRTCDGSCKRSASDRSATGGETDSAGFCTCGLHSVYPPVVTSPDGRVAYHHHLHPLQNLMIQANKKSFGQFTDHEVVWSWTDDIHPDSPDGDRLAEAGRGRGTGTGNFVRSLKLGDVVTLWGKARFPGWCNIIESVKVEIYWAV